MSRGYIWTLALSTDTAAIHIDGRFPALTTAAELGLAAAPCALQWGDSEKDRVRGVNLIRIRDGKIIEARGYMMA